MKRNKITGGFQKIKFLAFALFCLAMFFSCTQRDIYYYTYTISFDSQGGTAVDSKSDIDYGTKITLPETDRYGYTFSGWYTYSLGGAFAGGVGSSYTVTSDVTLYAHWTPITYVISYDANGGTVSPTNVSQAFGTTIRLPAPIRSGYTFAGWYTSSTGGTKVGVAGDNYEVNSSITFYAQWTHTVSFDVQGGNSISDITVAVGSGITLPTPSRNGYTFLGWYTLYSGGTRVGGAGDSYSFDANIKLYAHWGYTVSFDSQTGNSISDIKVEVGTVITLPTPSRSGYTFEGWFSASSGGAKYDSPYTVTTNDVTMYARWNIIDTESGTTKTINGIECVLVKAGTFWMGDDGYWGNVHQVTLTKDYWVSKYEVTQGQYEAAMGINPSDFVIGDNYPVNNVDWNDATAFCNAVGGRLLTEAEWEFAARGGNKSKGYIYSGSNNLDEVGWYYYDDNSNMNDTSHPVGQKKANELGIYDMSGNVWEWVNDWYGYFPSGAVTDPEGPSSGSDRVIRGGCWFYNSYGLRVASRSYDSPSDRGNGLGLRVAFNAN